MQRPLAETEREECRPLLRLDTQLSVQPLRPLRLGGFYGTVQKVYKTEIGYLGC